MNEILQSKLMELFIIKDFMANNKYLPLSPRRQAFEDYANNPIIQQRVNGVVGDIFRLVEVYGNAVHSEEN